MSKLKTFAVRGARFLPMAALAVTLAACTARGTGTSYLNSRNLPGQQLYVAVLPFENLTNNPSAGIIIGDLVLTDVQSRDLFRIQEPSETRRLLSEMKIDINRLADASVARKVARSLGVDAVLVGHVSEFAYQHGLREEPAVGMSARLVGAREGRILWNANQSRMGGGFLRRESIVHTAQQAVREMVDSLDHYAVASAGTVTSAEPGSAEQAEALADSHFYPPLSPLDAPAGDIPQPRKRGETGQPWARDVEQLRQIPLEPNLHEYRFNTDEDGD
ncbi:MAG: hypothetical protein H7831_14420 [Magnetococcus sp. WYHC-3]